MLVLGAPALIVAALVCFLPETTERELPQNMRQAIDLNTGQERKVDAA